MFKKPLREFFMRKKVIIGIAAGVLITAILVFVGVICASAYIGRTVSFDEDERLFNAAKSGTMTKFYANGGEYGGEYLPVEISTITMDEKRKSYYSLAEISEYLNFQTSFSRHSYYILFVCLSKSSVWICETTSLIA